MSTDTWHASGEMLGAYARGEGGLATTASVEAHLMACPECRARVALKVQPGPLDATWSAVADRLHAEKLPFVVRLLRRAGLSENDSVLLAAARSLDGAWTLATLAVLVFAALAAIPGVADGRALYLLVAPLVPVIGVVAAFQSSDPLAALTITTPYSQARLALLRTVAVVVTSVPAAVAIGFVVPGIAWLAFAWLLPALALTVITLLAMTWLEPEQAGAGVVITWSVLIALAYANHDIANVVRPGLQVVYLAVAVIAAAGLALRIGAARTPGGYA
jgi:hypothetical protein